MGKIREISGLQTRIDVQKVLLADYTSKMEALSDPETRANPDKMVTLAKETLPPGFNVRPFGRLAVRVFRNYLNGSLKDKMTPPNEREIMESLCRRLRAYDTFLGKRGA